MKAILSTDLLRVALSRCFDACEKKTSESVVSLSFSDSNLTLSAKGSFTFYEEIISVISADEDCDFCITTFSVALKETPPPIFPPPTGSVGKSKMLVESFIIIIKND